MGLAAVLMLLGCESESGSHSKQRRAAPASSQSSTAQAISEAPEPPPPRQQPAPGATEAPPAKVDLPESLVPPDQRPLAASDRGIAGVFDDYGFPPHAGLVHFCKRRLLEAGAIRTTLDGFESRDPPTKLVAFYESRLSKRGMSTEGPETSWRLPPDSPAPTRTLTITRASAERKHRLWCPKPSAEATSLVLLSHVD